MMISRTLVDLLIEYRIASDMQEALCLCEMGLVRLNGAACTNGFYVPQEGDRLSTLQSDYTYLVSSREFLGTV